MTRIEPIDVEFNGDGAEEDELTLFSEEYIGISLGMLDRFHLNPYTIQASNTNQTASCFNNEILKERKINGRGRPMNLGITKSNEENECTLLGLQI